MAANGIRTHGRTMPNWLPNRGACIGACLSGDVTRSFWLYDIKLLSVLLRGPVKKFIEMFTVKVQYFRLQGTIG